MVELPDAPAHEPADAHGTGDASASPGYPEHWEADVVLRDGRTMRVRPVVPGDADALQTMHKGQSESSVVFRFFAPRAELSAAELHHFTNVDHHDRVALVLIADGTLHGVGRFDATQDGEAEVAFYVSDALHGLGLGSVLLEHLAAAGREVGVTTFTAEVLPHNGKMLGVFRDAGFPVKAHTEDGVLFIRIDIEETAASWAVRAERERRAESVSMASILAPTGVLLGSCGEPRAHDALALDRVRTALARSGWVGTVLDGDPRALEAAAPDAEASPDTEKSRSDQRTEIAVLAGPPDEVVAAVPAAARLGARGLVVVSGGFAEDGTAAGRGRQRALLAATRAAGIRLFGPLSLGVLVADGDGGVLDLLASHTPEPADYPEPLRAGVGLFGQSPESANLLLTRARARGLPIASLLTAGNRADVSGNDTMQWWSVHEPTTVGVTYLESIGNPRKYSRIARHLSRSTPVVALLSATVARAALPGHEVRTSRHPARVVDELLHQAGVLRTATMTETLDLVSVLATQPVPRVGNIAVVASSPGFVGLVTGLLADVGISVVTARSVDLPAGPGALAAALAELPEDCDVVLVALSEALGDVTDAHAAAVGAAAAADTRTWIVVDDTRSGLHPAYRVAEHAVPVLATTRAAVRVLTHLRERSRWMSRDDAGLLDPPPGTNLRPARAVVARHTPQDLGEEAVLDAATTRTLLDHLGIAVLPVEEVADPDAAAEATRRLLADGASGVVLKLADPVLASRSHLGGLRVGIHGPEAAADAWRDLDATRGGLGRDTAILLQRAAPPGVACVVRGGEDPLYGPVVSLGLSGDASELLDDVSYRVAPLTRDDATSMVDDLRGAGRLTGADGYPRVDLDALTDLVTRVAELVDDAPDVRELTLDPVLATPGGIAVAGARVILARAARQDTARRTLSGPEGTTPPR